MSPPLPVLDAEDIHGYPDDVAMLLQEYGALVVRGAVGPDECARCRADVEVSLHRAMAAAGQISTGDDIHRSVTDEQAAAGHRQGLTLVHFQLNLSRLCAPRNPTHECVPNALKLSSNVNECKPLGSGTSATLRARRTAATSSWR
jgi:hypothetical protein